MHGDNMQWDNNTGGNTTLRHAGTLQDNLPDMALTVGLSCEALLTHQTVVGVVSTVSTVMPVKCTLVNCGVATQVTLVCCFAKVHSFMTTVLPEVSEGLGAVKAFETLVSLIRNGNKACLLSLVGWSDAWVQGRKW